MESFEIDDRPGFDRTKYQSRDFTAEGVEAKDSMDRNLVNRNESASDNESEDVNVNDIDIKVHEEDKDAEVVDRRKGESKKTLHRRQKQTSIDRLDMQKKKIEESLEAKKRKRQYNESDDYVGTDMSCCIFIPIRLSINIIGVLTFVEGALLLL